MKAGTGNLSGDEGAGRVLSALAIVTLGPVVRDLAAASR